MERRAEATVKGLYQHAASLTDREERERMARRAVASENRNRIVNMVESAKRMVPVHPNEFDTDAMLLNVRTGPSTYAPRSSSPTEEKTDITYDPNAACNPWMGFLDRIFAGNEGLIHFVQRLFGYCLIGRLIRS